MLRTTILSTGAAALLFPAIALATISESTAVKFVTNVHRFDFKTSIQGWELSRFPLSVACTAAAGLSPPGTHGDTWYANGSTVLHNTPSSEPESEGLRVFVSGSATVPGSWTVGVNCGAGAEGVGIVPRESDGTPVLLFGNAGSGWLGCPATEVNSPELGEDAIVLVYRAGGQRPLGGCADMELIAVCADEAESHPDAVKVPCVVPE